MVWEIKSREGKYVFSLCGAIKNGNRNIIIFKKKYRGDFSSAVLYWATTTLACHWQKSISETPSREFPEKGPELPCDENRLTFEANESRIVFLLLFFGGKGLCVGVLKEITREGGEQRLKVHERCLTVHWQMLKVLYKRDYYYFLWLCVLEMFWWCIEFKFQSYNLLQPLFLCQLTGCCQRAPGRMVLNGSQHTHTPRNHFSTPPLSIPIRARPSKCQLPDYSISLSRFVSNTAPPTAETRKNFFM